MTTQRTEPDCFGQPRTFTVHLRQTYGGETVELADADSYSGPGNCFSGQHVNATATFLRKPGGPWRRSTQRSRHKTIDALLGYETADEALDGICGTDR